MFRVIVERVIIVFIYKLDITFSMIRYFNFVHFEIVFIYYDFKLGLVINNKYRMSGTVAKFGYLGKIFLIER